MEFLALGITLLFLVLLAVGVPVYSAMGGSALLGIYLLEGGERILQKTTLIAYNALDSFVLLAVPLALPKTA